MADVAGLVVGLLPLAWAAYNSVDTYLSGLKQRDTEIQGARVQLDIFRGWINFINDKIIAQYPLDEEEQGRIHRCSVIARKRVEELDHFVTALKLDAAPDPDSQPGWAKRHARELRYPLQRKRLKELQETLSRVNTDLERAFKPFEHHFHEQHHLRTDAGFARITELVENLTVQTTKIQNDLSICNQANPATIASSPTSPDSGSLRPLTLDEMECLQIFRLIHGESDASYEWYKDRVDERVADTCLWFLNHENYKTWRQQRAGPLLVTADPGCGKSVLAKYLIDAELPRDATVCYFFFKDQDQNKINQALCAILHQMFSARPDLLHHARAAKDRNGKELVKVTSELRSVFEAVIRDPDASNTVFVFDALDECDPVDLQVLVDMMNNAFVDAPPDFAIKCLMTSRPYEQVSGEFFYLADKFPHIRIPGEQESDIIKFEVERVIHARIKTLAAKKRLSAKLQEHLTLRLLEITHRTYLWAYLVFDYLEKSIIRRTERGLDAVLRNLPTSIYDAYEKILSRSVDEDFVKRSLSFIAAAIRPLEISELNVALQIDASYTSSQDLDLEEDVEFELRLRECCGLFLTIDHGKVYFLHQTAREFLLIHSPRLAKTSFAVDRGSDTHLGSNGSPTPGKWQGSILLEDAEYLVAEACVRYLMPFDSEVFDGGSIKSADDIERIRQTTTENLDFLLYSVRYWGSHLRWAQESLMFPSILKIFKFENGYSEAYWRLASFERRTHRVTYSAREFATAQYQLHLAAEMDHLKIAEYLFDSGASVNAYPDDHIHPPLRAAVLSGSADIVQFLLQRGADVNGVAPRATLRQTAVFPTSTLQVGNILEILLQAGADPNYRDQDGRTPLFYAHDGQMAEPLLQAGADVDATDREGHTPICNATRNEVGSCISMLLRWGASPNTRTVKGWTPLFGTVPSAWWEGLEILLKGGGDINAFAPDNEHTIWQCMAKKVLEGPSREGEAPVPGELLELIQTRLDFDPITSLITTPLHIAAQFGLRDTIANLIQAGALVDARDEDQTTPLIKAASSKYRNTEILKLLLGAGADPNAMSMNITPLLATVYQEWEDGIRILLAAGANTDVGTEWAGSSVLHIAASFGLESILRALIEGGANVNALDEQGRSALQVAEEMGEDGIARILESFVAEAARL